MAKVKKQRARHGRPGRMPEYIDAQERMADALERIADSLEAFEDAAICQGNDETFVGVSVSVNYSPDLVGDDVLRRDGEDEGQR
jgi:hypothetical protein